MTDDVTPTPEDAARDLRADLAWALKQIRWDGQLWYGWAIAAQRRALAAETKLAGLLDRLSDNSHLGRVYELEAALIRAGKEKDDLHRLLSVRDARVAELNDECGGLSREAEGLRKANALLLAGMESRAELMHDLKQEVRQLRGEACPTTTALRQP